MARLLPFRDQAEPLSLAEFRVLIQGWRDIQRQDGTFRDGEVVSCRLALYRYARRHICRSYRGGWEQAVREVRVAENIVRATGGRA